MMACINFSAMASNKITIQSPSYTTDSYGGRAVTWATQSTAWAIITPTSGNQTYAQGAIQSRVTHKIVIRFQSALKNIATISAYRISFDSRLFAVVSIKNLGKDMKSEGSDFQEILVEENAADVAG